MRRSRFTLAELLATLVCGCGVAALAVAAADGGRAAKIAACADVMRRTERRLSAWENDHYGVVIHSISEKKLRGRQLADGGYFDDVGFYHPPLRIYPREFECPAETRQRSNGKVNIAHPSVNILLSYDYALNWNIHNRPTEGNDAMFLRTQVNNPARLMRMVDAVKHAVNYKGDYATNRHGTDGANVLFFDGHVKFMPVLYKGVRGYSHYFWFNE